MTDSEVKDSDLDTLRETKYKLEKEMLEAEIEENNNIIKIAVPKLFVENVV